MMRVRVLRRPEGAPDGPEALEVDAQGATIGRSADCDLMLDDPLRFVSRRHARVVPQDEGTALLRCISANSALFVNGRDLPPNGECLVRGGDRVQIGGYELVLEQLMPESAIATVPAAVRGGVKARAPDVPAAPGSRLDRWFDLDSAADPLGPGSPLPAADEPLPTEPAPLAADAPEPAAPRVPAPAAPTGPPPPSGSGDRRRPPTADAAPAPAAPVAHGSDTGEPALRRAFLHGAGLDPTLPWALNPDSMEHLGALLRAAAEGTLELLRDRAAVMHRLRADGGWPPALRATNPLQTALDADEALRLLLAGASRPGQLPPLEALLGAYRELQAHHQTLLTGLRAAASDLVSKLDPQAAEAAEGPAGALDRWLPARRQAALWRRHQRDHAKLLDSLDQTLETALGRELAGTPQGRAKPAPGLGEWPDDRILPPGGRSAR